MKLRCYTPCPVLQQHGPFDPPEVKDFRKQGLVCMGPYHNDRWYIFHPKSRPTPRTLREKICGFTNKLSRR
jgi:hypothetical protein